MVKRLIDIVFALTGLILLIPVFLSIALLIKVNMPGSVIFRQIRTGRYGKPFVIYKFRTMIENHGGSTISLNGEERITPLGAKLRKYKLDEIPELWNVLKGDMSIVGPRPDVPEYMNRLAGEERLILDLRPGITSPASLKYANEEEIVASAPEPHRFYDEVIWPDKVRLNLNYYFSRNLISDLHLILKTIFHNIRF